MRNTIPGMGISIYHVKEVEARFKDINGGGTNRGGKCDPWFPMGKILY